MEEKQKLLFDLLRLQDEERQTLSHDLYHDIGQTMYSLTLAIKMVVKQNIDSTTKQHLLQLEKAIDNSLEKLREISFALHPFMIEDLGLIDTLGSFLRRMELTVKCQIKLTVMGEPVKLPLEKEHLIYRICQEIVNYVAARYTVNNLSIELTYGEQEQSGLVVCVESPSIVSAEQVANDLILTTIRIDMLDGTVEFVEGKIKNSVEIRIRIP
ncbi:sensor histidine kinase [Brevibacillus fluminis]|uniref:sensor histidine kinase n=1 Tax=Brevibacillus fluminis TaxID=511487 RepID=UPI003F8C6BA5